MTGLSDYAARAALDAQVAAYPYVGAFSAVGTDSNTGFIEITNGVSLPRAYSAGAWGTATGSAPSTVTSTATITVGPARTDLGVAIAFGLFDQPIGGILGPWDYFGDYQWLQATVSRASPGIICAPGHRISVGNVIVFSSEYGGGTPPSFSAGNFTGLLTVTNVTTDTLAVTNSGIAVNTSSSGSGSIRRVTPLPLNPIVSGLEFLAGFLTISSA
jgi:hypothetical protein